MKYNKNTSDMLIHELGVFQKNKHLIFRMSDKLLKPKLKPWNYKVLFLFFFLIDDILDEPSHMQMWSTVVNVIFTMNYKWEPGHWCFSYCNLQLHINNLRNPVAKKQDVLYKIA